MKTIEEKLLDQLNEETKYWSENYQSHEIFKKMVKKGKDILPLLYNKLYKDNNGYTLIITLISTIITDRPLISEEYRGKIYEIRKIWLKWGIEHNFIQENTNENT